MAKPTSRASFKEYCLRNLGKPVIEINVADEQIEDRIDEAVSYWNDYHFDGTEKVYYKHQLTEQDIENQYINIPENIIGAVNIFDLGLQSVNSQNFFSVQYQIAMTDLFTLTSQSMVPYYMTMQHLALIQEILVGKQPIRYNRHTNKLYIDMNWRRVTPGHFLIVEAYQVLDPEVATDMWSDRWLLEYCTQLIKRQWGSNLIKFSGVPLVGGIQFNGEKIYNDAEQRITKLQEEMINTYSLPVSHLVG